jgi:hypothetical protein
MKINKTVSLKVIDANRKNAQRNTGPTSIAGKDAVRYNALKHGLLAKRIVLHNEEEEIEFQALMDELDQEFQPKGMLERMLTEENPPELGLQRTLSEKQQQREQERRAWGVWWSGGKGWTSGIRSEAEQFLGNDPPIRDWFET